MSTWTAIVGPVRCRVERHRSQPEPRRRAAVPPRRPSVAAPTSAPWLAVCPVPARVLRDPTAETLRSEDSGAAVVLVSDRVLGRRRLRSAARSAGLEVDRELLVLPGTRRTIVAVDEDPAALGLFWRSVAVVPPGVTWASLPATMVLRAARHLPASWAGALVGGHVLIGRRP